MTDSQTTPLPIDGMSCSHCVQRVQDALEAVEGVTKADVDLDAAQATVTHTGAVSHDTLAQAVADAGYDVPAAA